MGWVNYIIIDQFKLLIETNREINDIAEYETEAITNILNADKEDDRYIMEDAVEMQDVKINEITIGDLATLFRAYKNVDNLYGIGVDKFLLFWLNHREIKYKIVSEYNVNLQEYLDKGYVNIEKIYKNL